MALSSHAKAGSLIVLDSIAVKDGKTKALTADLAKLGFGKSALVIDGDAVENSFVLAAGNLFNVNVLPAIGANVYDILKADTLVLTRAAVEKLEARFKGKEPEDSVDQPPLVRVIPPPPTQKSATNNAENHE